MDAPPAWWHTSALRSPNTGVEVITLQSTLEATVLAELPQQLYRLETDDGPLIAGRSEEAKRLGLQIRTGQRVLVKRTSLDPGRGIIVALAPLG